LCALYLVARQLLYLPPRHFCWCAAISFTLRPRNMALNGVTGLGVHANNPSLRFEPVPPSVVRPHIGIRNADLPHPAGKILTDFFVLGIAAAASAMEGGVVKQGADLSRDHPQKALIENMRVERHSAS